MSRTSHRNRAAALGALLAAAAAVACKKNDGEAAAGGYVQGQTGPAGGGGAPVAAAGQGGAPSAPGATGGATTTAPAAAGAPATDATPGMAPGKLDPSLGAALAPALAELAKKDVQPGAKPVGEMLFGNFTPGMVLEIPVQLQPNKCYSVVATALPPVTEVSLELQLSTPIPGMAPVLAVDQDTGPTAVLGRKTTCYRWMFGVIPAPGKVLVRVTAGSGIVLAQAYEK